jgi:hypothetical protein
LLARAGAAAAPEVEFDFPAIKVLDLHTRPRVISGFNVTIVTC